MSKTGLNRIITDKFYTKEEVVLECLKYIPKIEKDDLVIEPSAGNGSFSDKLREHYNIIAIDIIPEKEYILKQDFFNFNPPDIRGKIHTIGNPPFGRQSSLAKKFIKRSCSFSDTISFILPKSFKKDSFMSSFNLHFHLISNIDLPKNSFLLDGKEYDVPCVFQVWEKKNIERKIIIHSLPSYYEYVKKSENPNLSIRRVGFYAGEICLDYKAKSIQSHYFLRLDENINIQDFLKRYKETVFFEFNNSVGARSISKGELNDKLDILK